MNLEFKEMQYYDSVGYMVYKDNKYIGRLKYEEYDWLYYPTNESGIGSSNLSLNEMQEIIDFLEYKYN